MIESQTVAKPKMHTIAEMQALSSDVKFSMLKEAKGGSWYDGWKPYCVVCDTMNRMKERKFGFECANIRCRNLIGWDLTRLQESPLNKNDR